MRYSQRYQHASARAYVVTRRCRRCEEHYETSDQDCENLCLRCLHDQDFEERVAAWFLRNPRARFEVYTTICDDRTARVFLKGGHDWVEYEDPHPVYLEAVRRRRPSTTTMLARGQADDGEQG